MGLIYKQHSICGLQINILMIFFKNVSSLFIKTFVWKSFYAKTFHMLLFLTINIASIKAAISDNGCIR